jgi:hypothetical protein
MQVIGIYIVNFMWINIYGGKNIGKENKFRLKKNTSNLFPSFQ